MTSLHPMLTVGRQLTEHVRLHLGFDRRAAEQRALELLEQVRIPDGREALRAYPHQFSGGMRQRIAIAIALACRPKLLIADEPTTALDVTVQAGILRLLDRLRRENDLAVILITHDLGVMSAIADRVSIFYAGRVVEAGPREDVLRRPRHPYTRSLLDALPHPELPPRPAARGDSGSAAESRQHPARLRVQPALRVRAGGLPRQRPRARRRQRARARLPRRPVRDERARAHRRRRRLRAPRRRPRPRGRRGEHQRRERADRRARRRVGLRQVDARAGRGRARPADVGDRGVRGARHRPARPPRPSARARTPPARLPEPVRLAQPAPEGRLAARGRARHARPRCRRRRGRPACGSCASSSACRPPRPTGSRTSSPAGSASGSRSRAPSPPSRR